MGTRLRNLVQEMRGKKLSDGKGLSGKNRLTVKIINAIQNYYGMAIRQNVANVYAMKKSIIAILYHCSENEDLEDRHKYCPRTAESWCKYQSDKITNKNTYKTNISLPPAIRILLVPIFKDLSKDDLLMKCCHGKTQNVNEALHSVIWQRCPKEIYTARSVVEIAAASAAINYNEGAMGIRNVFRRLGIFPGKFMEKLARKKNMKRLNDSLNKSSEQGKKRRKKLRSIKKGYEDKEKEQGEGESYASGAY